MSNKATKYSAFDNADICSILEQGDSFYGERIAGGKPVMALYTIVFKPVFFDYSKGWTCRCTTRSLNEVLKLGDNFQLTEFIYINNKCMHKYLFAKNHITFFLSQKPKKQTLEERIQIK